MKLIDTIPKQQFKEIHRLKKLVGVDLTFHGPLVEASGFERGSGWSEVNRENQERQLWSAIERAHELEPTGNIVVTLHSSSGLPELKTRIKGKDGEEVPEIIVIDERTGSADHLKPKDNFLLGKKKNYEEELEFRNKETWENQLSQLAHHARIGSDAV